MDPEREILSLPEDDERKAMKVVVTEEIEDAELEECVARGVDECIVNQSFPCGLCSKICKSGQTAEKLLQTDTRVSEAVEISARALNLVMIHISDLVVGFYKRGNVKEKIPVIKPIEQSEYGPLSYVAGYIIAKMFRKSKGTEM